MFWLNRYNWCRHALNVMVNLNHIRTAPLLYRKIAHSHIKPSILTACFFNGNLNLKLNGNANHNLNRRWISTNDYINLNQFDLVKKNVWETFHVHSSDANVKPPTGLKDDNLSNSVVTDLDLKDFVIPDPPSEVPLPKVYTFYPPAEDFKITWWLPTGWSYNLLMSFHYFEPWYLAIPTVTLLVRIMMTPLMIKSQSNATKMRNISPKLKQYNEKLSDAKASGNNLEISRFSMKLRNLYTDNGIKFKSLLLIPLCQFLVFGSFFLTLRILSSSTLSSLHTEGFFWCSDLTTTDPYYILNLITAVTLYAILKIGVEFGNVGSYTQSSRSSWAHLIQKASIYFIPGGVLLFSISFPSAICLYWASNNVLSLLQILILRNAFVRKYLKMPQIDKSATTFERNQAGFLQQFKDSWKSRKRNTGEPMTRKSQEVRFERAGLGPIKKTYDYDPTKVRAKQK